MGRHKVGKVTKNLRILVRVLKNLITHSVRYKKRNITYLVDYTASEYFDFMADQIKRLETHATEMLLIGPLINIEEVLKRLMFDVPYIKLETYASKKNIKQKLKKMVEILPKVIVIVENDPKRVYDFVKILIKEDKLSGIKLIYKIGIGQYYKTLNKYDGYYKSGRTIDNNLDYELFNHIYEKSLQIFEKKCQIRDALDLFQCLSLTSDVSGDIVEIGSYKGHSGWLITRLSERLSKKSKKIYLCDTFDKFPVENRGLDKVWSNTHKVDYDSILEKFRNFNNVHLVKGDIRQTLNTLSDKTWSFIYLDVDSYSGTLYAIKKLYPELAKGGIMLCQDYGKLHCVGVRLAVDEYFESDKTFCYFSFFSGCKLYIKP